MENLLNFRQFVTNAAALLNTNVDLPHVSLDMPTTATARAVEVFSVHRKGKTYEIKAEDNVAWFCPAEQYIHLMHAGRAPRAGDKIRLEFYRDGSVKSCDVVSRGKS